MSFSASNRRGLILLDRDGVLNEMVVDPEHGTVDSPLHPSQVKVVGGIPRVLRDLCDIGYQLAIVTNQPAAAKGKTTIENLKQVQVLIETECQSLGAKILVSEICFHRREDRCECRKPKPGMLNHAIAVAGENLRSSTWMVGDGVTDIEAGIAAGVKTAFVGLTHCSSCQIMKTLQPDRRFGSLAEFRDFIKGAAL